MEEHYKCSIKRPLCSARSKCETIIQNLSILYLKKNHFKNIIIDIKLLLRFVCFSSKQGNWDCYIQLIRHEPLHQIYYTDQDAKLQIILYNTSRTPSITDSGIAAKWLANARMYVVEDGKCSHISTLCNSCDPPCQVSIQFGCSSLLCLVALQHVIFVLHQKKSKNLNLVTVPFQFLGNTWFRYRKNLRGVHFYYKGKHYYRFADT